MSATTQMFQTKLANGLTVLYLYTKNDPISACHLFIPGGTSQEPDHLQGATTLMWSMFLKGTTSRSARQLAEDIEGIGASMGAGGTHDYSEISCHSVSDYFLTALKIMQEALFEPAFLAAEVEKERTALAAGLRAKKESIFTVAYEQMASLLYKTHPYARPAGGKEEIVLRLTSKDLSEWHRALVYPNNAVLTVASNMPFKEMLPHLKSLFGPDFWPKKKKAPKISFKAAPALKASVEIKKTEAFEQAYLIQGFPSAPLGSKDYLPLKVLNACLGGGMSARLFQRLREEQGLAYEVGAFYPSKRQASVMVVHMGLQESKLAQARAGIEKELADVRDKKISNKELRETVNYLKGTYILDHQTNSQRAHYLGWWHMLGLKMSYDKEYIRKLEKITSTQVQAVAKKYLGKKSVTIEIHPKSGASAANEKHE